MKLTEVFLPQLEREAAVSQRILARVPEGRPDWKPHEKSMALGYLATLVATMPTWVTFAVVRDELDLDPPGGPTFRPAPWKTRAELLAQHEEAVTGCRDSLRTTSEEHLMTKWRLLVAGKAVLESPRHVVIADTFTHLAHHRGQLSVYLRLNDVPLPSLYGPSADERTFS
jgi:uncharacterized damage-inducible protein DinB